MFALVCDSSAFPMKIVVFIHDSEMVLFYYSGTMNAAAPEGTPPRRIDE